MGVKATAAAQIKAFGRITRFPITCYNRCRGPQNGLQYPPAPRYCTERSSDCVQVLEVSSNSTTRLKSKVQTCFTVKDKGSKRTGSGRSLWMRMFKSILTKRTFASNAYVASQPMASMRAKLPFALNTPLGTKGRVNGRIIPHMRLPNEGGSRRSQN
jgi:hypothetical protein